MEPVLQLEQTTQFDFATIGNSSYPTGFRGGYFDISDGKSYTGSNTSRTRTKVVSDRSGYDRFTVVAPASGWVNAVGFSAAPSYDRNADNSAIYVEGFKAENGATLTVTIKEGVWYYISIQCPYSTIADNIPTLTLISENRIDRIERRVGAVEGKGTVSIADFNGFAEMVSDAALYALPYDFCKMIGNASYPLGFRGGYFSASTGAISTSGNYSRIRSVSLFTSIAVSPKYFRIQATTKTVQLAEYTIDPYTSDIDGTAYFVRGDIIQPGKEIWIKYTRGRYYALTINTPYSSLTMDDMPKVTAYTDTAEYQMTAASRKMQNNDDYGSKISNRLTLLHVSDMHGERDAFDFAVDVRNRYSRYIDDVLNTGDTVFQTYEDGVTDYIDSGLAAIALHTIGNHDTAVHGGGGDSDGDYEPDEGNYGDVSWRGLPRETRYNVFYAPYKDGWGVTMGDAAYACYWYKDYATAGIRLIGLDVREDISELTVQLDWIKTKMTEAKAAGYGVILASHYQGMGDTGRTGIRCNWTSYSNPNNVVTTPADSPWGNTGWAFQRALTEYVQSYIESGGEFIVWLGGHNHRNKIAKIDGTDILCITMDKTSSRHNKHDMPRRLYTPWAFSANLMTIDRETKQIKIKRFGTNVDMWMRPVNGICLNYVTGEIIGQM